MLVLVILFVWSSFSAPRSSCTMIIMFWRQWNSVKDPRATTIRVTIFLQMAVKVLACQACTTRRFLFHQWQIHQLGIPPRLLSPGYWKHASSMSELRLSSPCPVMLDFCILCRVTFKLVDRPAAHIFQFQARICPDIGLGYKQIGLKLLWTCGHIKLGNGRFFASWLMPVFCCCHFFPFIFHF